MVIFWSFDKGFDWRSCRISKRNQTDCCYLIASVIVLYRVRQGFYLQFLFIAFIGKNRNLDFFYYFKFVAKNFRGMKIFFAIIEIRILLHRNIIFINYFGSFTYKKTVSIFWMNISMNFCMHHRIILIQNTFKIMESSQQPYTAKGITKPFPQVPHLHVLWTPPSILFPHTKWLRYSVPYNSPSLCWIPCEIPRPFFFWGVFKLCGFLAGVSMYLFQTPGQFSHL